MPVMPVAKTKRATQRPKKAAAKPKAVKRPTKSPAKHQGKPWPEIDLMIDTSAGDAFRKLPLAERRRRLKAFQAALGPALADYSSEDFRRDQRREAERDH